MFEKIFGKKKSIQRGLIRDIIIGNVIVLVATIIGFFLIVDNQALNRLLQIELTSEQEIEEIISIVRRAIFLLILNSIFISLVIVRITSKKMILPITKLSSAAKKVADGA